MEVAVNTCYGGFNLSNKAIKKYYELIGQKVWFYQQTKTKPFDNYDEFIETTEENTNLNVYPYSRNFGHKVREDISNYAIYLSGSVERNDPALIQVIKELGDEASGVCSKIKVIEIPDNVDFTIEDYDGVEYVSEKHRVWSYRE